MTAGEAEQSSRELQQEGRPSVSSTTEYMNFKAPAPSTVYIFSPIFSPFWAFTAQSSLSTKRHFIPSCNQSVYGRCRSRLHLWFSFTELSLIQCTSPSSVSARSPSHLSLTVTHTHIELLFLWEIMRTNLILKSTFNFQRNMEKFTALDVFSSYSCVRKVAHL